MAKSYYRVRLGEGGKNAEECLAGGFIGTDFSIREDLAGRLPEDWRSFNREFIPIIIEADPGKSRVAAGLNSAALWTVSKGILIGDLVLSPDARGRIHVGEVTGEYFYEKDGVLPHRRPVTWRPVVIDHADMSDLLWRSIRGPLTVVNATSHADEIESIVSGSSLPVLVATDESVEDPTSFAMEKHLEASCEISLLTSPASYKRLLLRTRAARHRGCGTPRLSNPRMGARFAPNPRPVGGER